MKTDRVEKQPRRWIPYRERERERERESTGPIFRPNASCQAARSRALRNTGQRLDQSRMLLGSPSTAQHLPYPQSCAGLPASYREQPFLRGPFERPARPYTTDERSTVCPSSRLGSSSAETALVPEKRTVLLQRN